MIKNPRLENLLPLAANAPRTWPTRPEPKSPPTIQTTSTAPGSVDAHQREDEDEDESGQGSRQQRRISGGSLSVSSGRASLDSRRRSSLRTEPDAPYPHVSTTIRSVKQSTIDARWAPLTAASVAAASETLALAHRPIMQRLASNGQRRRHTASALSLLDRRIARKLQRGLPFPPAAAAPSGQAAAAAKRRGRPRGIGSGKTAGVEAELDFESVLDGSQALERQLEPLLHAVELLRREKDHMERELELDYKNLRNLEAGARGQARVRRDQIKKAHVLVPEAPSRDDDNDDGNGNDDDNPRRLFGDGAVEMVSHRDGRVPSDAVFKDLDDDQLKSLALQLSGHVDSMTTNLEQTDGLTARIAEARTALRATLLKHLDPKQYDQVVLG
ncbi:kinetochore protein Fta7 [Geosmithia morbida]|uniref:Kinetochore protein Fta7 n=1 Tax=Geosmithia morbida TaxID=1094350 RepID=A0A9P5D782_9HYPO|nr:kinetochore protein Fta7 [Geosmithia morbida]KAF4126361.1 kinetochore protein Fta7 [Geosmithia morbida]